VDVKAATSAVDNASKGRAARARPPPALHSAGVARCASLIAVYMAACQLLMVHCDGAALVSSKATASNNLSVALHCNFLIFSD
jgi:hypothetical protein